MSYWPHFIRPFWLLALLPMLWLIWQWWHSREDSSEWDRYIPAAFRAYLISAGEQQRPRWTLVALLCAVFCMVIALAGPSWQQLKQPKTHSSAPLVVVLQLSQNMLAADAAPNRLAFAQRKIIDILNDRGEGPVALIAYAGSSHVVAPLTIDRNALKNLLPALSPSIMPLSGNRADLAVQQALDLLKQTGQGFGYIALLTDNLSEVERQGIERALGSEGRRLKILGIGTAEGAPIALPDGRLQQDESGRIVIPRLNAPQLQSFADSLGSHYESARQDPLDLSTLGLTGSGESLLSATETSTLDVWIDQGYWLLLPLVFIASLAGRRGWLWLIPLFWIMPQPTWATSWDDLWLRPDQQGIRLLQQGEHEAAAKRFEDPLWQGYALYQAGNYAAAAERFEQVDSAVALYNLGNCRVYLQDWQGAEEAYRAALQRDPSLDAAQKNLELLQSLQQSSNAETPAKPTQESKQHPQNPVWNASGQQQDSAQKQSNNANQSGAQNRQNPMDAKGISALEINEATGQPQTNAAQNPQELQQALEVWLQQIPDHPGDLLRRKFLLQQQRQQDVTP